MAKDNYNNIQMLENRDSLSDHSFQSKMNKLYGDEYAVLGKYVNSRTKVKIRHNNIKCGNYEWETYPRNLLQHHGCPRCSGRVVLTEQEFKEALGTEYVLKSEYHGVTKSVTIVHCNSSMHEEDYEFCMTPKQFMSGRRCPECERILATEQIRKEIAEESNNAYSLVGDFYCKSEKIRIRHNSEKCNYHEWDVTLYNFKKGKGCPKCNGSIVLTEQEFKELVGEDRVDFN